jgi:hypothetical protein
MDKGIELIMRAAELMDRALVNPKLWIVFGLGIVVRLFTTLSQSLPSEGAGWVAVVGDALVYGVAAVWAYDKRPRKEGQDANRG